LVLLLTRWAFVWGTASILTAAPPRLLSTTPSLQQQEAQFVRREISNVVEQDRSMAGPLLRLAFHDATTGKPNGSIRYELERYDNRALSKPLNIVKNIQSQLSLADCIALAGSEAVHSCGGPLILIRLGRRDVQEADPAFIKRFVSSSTSSRNSSNSNNNKNNNKIVNPFSQEELLKKTMPSPGLNSDGLKQYFGRLGLSEAEFVALSGSHGMGRHVSLLGMSKHCLKNLTRTCLEEAPVLLPFVTKSVDRFDQSYFVSLLKWYHRTLELGEVAFIPTDVALVVNSELRYYVEQFANNPELFTRTFARAYQKLVERGTTTRERY